MLDRREKTFLSLLLAIPGIPALAILAALVWEQGTAEPSYPYSGFCPDSPSFNNSLNPTD